MNHPRKSGGAGAAGRTATVPPELDGALLDRAVRSLFDAGSWGKARALVTSGKIAIAGRVVTTLTTPVHQGQLLELRERAPRPRQSRLAPEALLHVDAHVVVVEKPAGVSSVPFEPEEPLALDGLVAELLAQREGRRRAPLGVVHRLDKETSGVLVFARTLPAKRELKNQFRFHQVLRRYYALAHGHVLSQTFRSRLVQDRGDGRRGSTEHPELGREATTHVELLSAHPGASFLECRLETGRTHQIRIHLAEAGHPLLGERVYGTDYRGPRVAAPRVMLHAFELGFVHPVTGAQLHFEAPLPEDFEVMLRQLRDRSRR